MHALRHAKTPHTARFCGMVNKYPHTSPTNVAAKLSALCAGCSLTSARAPWRKRIRLGQTVTESAGAPPPAGGGGGEDDDGDADAPPDALPPAPRLPGCVERTDLADST